MNPIWVVGMGPGGEAQMTLQAREVLADCDVIVGYTVYVELLKKLLPDKEYRTTPMRQEVERCRMAFEEAKNGSKVAMVCSGDAGVYGMAGLMLELTEEYPDCLLEIVPGVTAALAGGALLGAPLGHDFAVISLSDLLTPWEMIEKRLRLAALADLSLCIYNPSSKKRADYLQRACDILLEVIEEERVCGLAVLIGREGEHGEILTLRELRERQVDMFTTVFIGNSQTRKCGGRMVTPRGYRIVV
ncbi:MAG: precorrin-3B C(17)-methyltransferase [Lachnospiraceae bacterium]|nr:precorrin-3B C(17)-methyltransferase [Lachnospiraceae bacterium]